jgi:glycosyltransferase involved in cell wall biosynthesis
MYVHQFSPTASFGDAISNQMLSLQRILRTQGHESEIFCEQLPLHFEGQARTVAEYGAYSSGQGVLLCHFGLSYSAMTLSWLRQVPDRKVLIYHNITPHSYFVGVNIAVMEAAKAGREQLSLLRPWMQAGWGDSDFNCDELRAYGWDHVGTLPIVFSPGNYAVRPSRKITRRYRSRFNVLHVGRVSPNKRLEDLILVFYYLKRHVRPDARLILVGSTRGMQPYLEYLQRLVAQLGLADVVFAGHVSKSDLVAFYRSADLYLCMSEHEGCCVPLLESMHFGVPIVAYDATAVPETLGGSGVLVKDKNYPAVAELIGVLAERKTLRNRIVVRQRERLEDFGPKSVGDRLQTLLRDLEAEPKQLR